MNAWCQAGKIKQANQLQAVVNEAAAVLARSGGLQLVQNNAASNTRYFVVGVRSPAHFGDGFWALWKLVGAAIEINITEVEPPPQDPDALYLWLVREINELERWANEVDPIQDHQPTGRNSWWNWPSWRS